MSPRQRADQTLVARGLFESRAKAQEAIEAGLVTADGVVVRKASEGIASSAKIVAQKAHPWVSRGGVKLAFALDHFGISVEGRDCMDVGASTGGFSQVLLSRRAHHVTAVDVGHGQLHPKLQRDPRLLSLESLDIRDVTPEDLPFPPSIIAMDVSFIPLTVALPAALALAVPPDNAPAYAVLLIKPQFEAGKKHVGRGGLIKDADIHAMVCEQTAEFVDSLGWQVDGIVPSPILGGEGNAEFLLAAHLG
ncbi:MAG: TlyA family RNA methyltransferase [Rhizobiales bacterium]|jgi:23S rRNA (cytidine1920-2'-O)/16S rRNA (cytidine1409-2'-O)-methyltransferase|nr:TlyA family RNA methyltransferase [Hyphomicrobiales bacterium]